MVTVAGVVIACATRNKEMEYSEVKGKALTELREVLNTQQEWVKVHAAEFLLWSGYPEGVSEVFKEEERRHSDQSQYRIGIWRVLAQAADSPDESLPYIGYILEAFFDTTGQDRIHAAETLAKLKISPVHIDEAISQAALQSSVKPLALYTLWSSAYTSADSMAASREAFLRLLQAEDPLERTIAAYSLRKLAGFTGGEWNVLADAALQEPPSSPAAVYMLSSAFVTMPEEEVASRERIREALLTYATAAGKGDRMEMAMALSERGGEEDIPLLTSLLANEAPLEKEADNADVRAAAAYALLTIIDRAQ